MYSPTLGKGKNELSDLIKENKFNKVLVLIYSITSG